jgi:hypothetical protein
MGLERQRPGRGNDEREQETRLSGLRWRVHESTANPMDFNGCEGGDPTVRSSIERSNSAGIARQPGTLKGDADGAVQESGGHGDKPNTLACASQIMSPISGSGYFGFIFGSGVFVLSGRREQVKIV